MADYDELAEHLIGHWRAGPTSLSVNVDLYLVGSYISYCIGEEWYLEDRHFDKICEELLAQYTWTQYSSLHPHCFSRSALESKRGYSTSLYPQRIINLSHAVLRLFDKEKSMATKIGAANPVKREITMQDLACVVTFDEDGVTIRRKGDQHRGKRYLVLSWDDVMDSALPFKYAGDKEEGDVDEVSMDDLYEPVSFLNYLP